MRSYSAILLCGVVAALATGTASAQTGSRVASAPTSAAPASMVLLDGKPIGPAEPWSAKPVGSYDLVIVLPQSMAPATLTISETAGKLGAVLFLREEPHPIPMDVAVNGTDLVLTLNRPEGPITIHMQRRGTNLSGNWTIGADESGTLEGKATL
jgi:hypothetical protein